MANFALVARAVSGTYTADVTFNSGTNTWELVNLVVGSAGVDTLTALSSPQFVDGQNRPFITTINAGFGSDTVNGSSTEDILNGEGGVDIVHGNGGNDTISGGHYTGNPGEAGDQVFGDGGDDTLYIGGTGNIASGGIGNDTFRVGGTAHTLDGGADDDTLIIVDTSANLSNATITGIEHLRLTPRSEASAATFTVALLNGFTDVSTLDVSQTIGLKVSTSGAFGSNFAANLGGNIFVMSPGSTVNLGHTTGEWLVSLSASSGTNFVTTGSGKDTIRGLNGNDTLNGGGGEDVVDGGYGADTLFGGEGNDTVSAGSVSGASGEAGDSLFGEGGNDILNVSTTGNTASGGTGNDRFNVAGTAHTLDGGADDDTLAIVAYNTNLTAGTITGIEHLRLIARSEGSTATLSAAQLNGFIDVGSNNASQTIGLSLGTAGSIGTNFAATLGGLIALAKGNNILTLGHTTQAWFISGSDGSDRITTGSGSDTINAGHGNDTLNGGVGNDIVDGGYGADVLVGSLGNDTLNGSYDVDTANYAASTAVSVTLGVGGAAKIASGGLAAGDTLSGIENVVGGTAADKLTGNDLANRLEGGAGTDTLKGSAGSDTLLGGADKDKLYGGAGRDKLTGGTGDDDFLFASTSEIGKTSSTRDVITDFTHGRDDIDLHDIDANSKTGGNQNFKFIGTAKFHKKAGELHYVKENPSGTSHDKMIIEGDTNGDGKADFQIELTGIKTLTSGDFVL